MKRNTKLFVLIGILLLIVFTVCFIYLIDDSNNSFFSAVPHHSRSHTSSSEADDDSSQLETEKKEVPASYSISKVEDERLALDSTNITGLVFDASGTPLDGVDIGVAISSLNTKPPPPIDCFVASFSSITNEIGLFSLSIYPHKRYYIAACKNNYLPVIVTATPEESLNILLKECSFNLEGKVIDEITGLPLENASVTIRYFSSGQKMVRLTHTDKEGAFFLDDSPDLLYTFRITKSGYDDKHLKRIPLSQMPKIIKLTPLETTDINIICKDISRSTVLQIVTINGELSYADSHQQHNIKLFCSPDSNELIDPNFDSKIQITAESYCNHTIRYADLLTGEPFYEVDLTPAATCVGRIVDQNKSPLEDIKIEALLNNDRTLFVFNKNLVKITIAGTESDNNGFFTMNDIPVRQKFRLKLSKNNYPPQIDPIEREVDFEGKLNIGDIVFKNVGTLVGTILDRNSRSIPGEWIMVKRPDKSYFRTISNEFGKYRIPIDRFNHLCVDKEGYQIFNQSKRVFIEPGQEITNNIVLEESGKIEGCVVDSDGQAVPGAYFIVDSEMIGSSKMVADQFGRFRISGFRNDIDYGIHALRNHPLDINIFAQHEKRFRAGDDNIVLEVISAGVVIGEILSSDGKAINGNKRVYVSRLESSSSAGFKFKNKMYSILLEAGSWQLKVRVPGFTETSETVRIDDGCETRRDFMLIPHKN